LDGFLRSAVIGYIVAIGEDVGFLFGDIFDGAFAGLADVALISCGTMPGDAPAVNAYIDGAGVGPGLDIRAGDALVSGPDTCPDQIVFEAVGEIMRDVIGAGKVYGFFDSFSVCHVLSNFL